MLGQSYQWFFTINQSGEATFGDYFVCDIILLRVSEL